jgi:S1-C subfamily serine protease
MIDNGKVLCKVLRTARWFVIVLAAVLAILLRNSNVQAATIQSTIHEAQAKIVKIYGAGGLRGMEAYQSGMLISPEGHILTVFSHVLDSESVTVVLADGRKSQAKLLGADPRLEIAVLKIDAAELPFFDLRHAAKAESGERILALSNVFGVATGDEPVSVQRGTLAVVTRLDARRGTFETPYHGSIYVLDVTVNNSGAAGGALVTRRGELLGMLGKELRNALNNTWLNYAIPIDSLLASTDAIRAGKVVVEREAEAGKKTERPLDVTMLGLSLVPDVLERTPPYVDHVCPGSPADLAGVRADDLILLLGDRLIQSCKAITGELENVDEDDEVRLTILRGHDLIEVTLRRSANASTATKKGQP